MDFLLQTMIPKSYIYISIILLLIIIFDIVSVRVKWSANSEQTLPSHINIHWSVCIHVKTFHFDVRNSFRWAAIQGHLILIYYVKTHSSHCISTMPCTALYCTTLKIERKDIGWKYIYSFCREIRLNLGLPSFIPRHKRNAHPNTNTWSGTNYRNIWQGIITRT